MQRLVLWLAMACLACIAGWFAWQELFAGERTVPMIPLLPATPARPEPGEGGAAVVHADGPTRSDASEPPVATDERPAVLEVRVTSRAGNGNPGPVAWRDVDALLVATPGAEAAVFRRQTNAGGIARFEIPRGHHRTVQVTAGQTATARTTLDADAATVVEITMVARVLVTGRVVDQAGNGVSGADLVLLPWIEPDSASLRSRRVGRCRSDGSFAVALGAGGRMGAEHVAFAPSALFAVPPPSDPTEALLEHCVEFVLSSRFATVNAFVRDTSGRPVPTAEIEFRSANPPPPGAVLAAAPRRAAVDAGGHALVANLVPGRLEFTARARGHAPARGTCAAEASTTTDIDIRLAASCEVQGIVQDGDGTRIPGARVWSGAADDFDGQWTVTDREGTFRLTDLPPGQVRLSAREGASHVPVLGARKARTTLDVVPGEVGHWVATVTSSGDDLVDGVLLDFADRPLPDWRLTLRAGTQTTATNTNDRGEFRARRITTGPLDVFAYAPATAVGAFADAVALAVDTDATPIRIVVDPTTPRARMTGRVLGDARAPIPATIVCLHHERRETAQFQAGADGLVDLRSIPPGTIDVAIEHPGRAPEIRRRLTARASQPIDLGTIVLGRAAVLTGAVRDATGAAPEQVELWLQTKERRIPGEYAAGVYRFPTAPPGPAVLQVQGAGIAADSFPVQLAAGVERTQDVELRAGVPRRIVVGAPDAAGPSVTLAIRPFGKPHRWLGSSVVRPRPTGSLPGAAEFVAWMAPGTYEVIAWTATGFEGRTSVTFTPGDDSEVGMDLAPQ
ncbi:MAG: carboxypeptidase regulatory-like domain-containing protein [Planctomycetes bacterium]|nr:carboxypeptidase regulatory-like domain-containing protein [Planctomycetota bacterium]